ncbi:Centrosomal protein of 76 kDa [Clydaea vesicula]|uniref:Centrosomal protein of 76 kDa n=1 Tax=Clydaea vesicula TaxID=447962 RepID=A0AAD5XZE7_9FUNG|nr:Centrosomal protein of 76 kDa [Clydaea vesicula]
MNLKKLHQSLESEDFKKILEPIVNGARDYNQEEFKTLLKDSGIIEKISDELLNNSKSPQESFNTADESQKKEKLESDVNSTLQRLTRIGKLYFNLTLGSGRAFLAFKEVTEFVASSLSVHFKWMNNRFSSEKVLSTIEPAFNENWIIELESTDLLRLLEIDEPFHFVVIRSDLHGNNTLLGTRNVEWRQVLCYGSTSKVVDIKDIYNPQVTVGLLELKINFFPSQLKENLIRRDELDFQLKKEILNQKENDRLFFIYAKRWWNDFLLLKQGVFNNNFNKESRMIKIFTFEENSSVSIANNAEGDSNDDFGGRKVSVTFFLESIKCMYHKMPCFKILQGSFLQSPKHAARFVSLIPFERTLGIGDTNVDVWPNLHTFLSLGKGDVQEHAVLLCNLFLGFHLNAYVACGLGKKFSSVFLYFLKDKQNSAHLWVVTIDSNNVVTFWESLTGENFKLISKEKKKTKLDDDVETLNKKAASQRFKFFPYRTIGCCQHTDSIENCDFNLEDENKWKSFSREAIQSTKRYNNFYSQEFPFKSFPVNINDEINNEGFGNDFSIVKHDSHKKYFKLYKSPLKKSSHLHDFEIELAIKQKIVEYREDHGFSKKFSNTANLIEDKNLKYVLKQKIFNLENEKIFKKSFNYNVFECSFSELGSKVENEEIFGDALFFEGVKSLLNHGETFKLFPGGTK